MKKKEKYQIFDTTAPTSKSVSCRIDTEKEAFHVKKYSFEDHHLKDKKLSRVHVTIKDKWSWRMLNPIQFVEFP